MDENKIRKRRCTCGCEKFEVTYTEYGCNIITASEDGEIDYCSEEYFGSEFTSNFKCIECGEEYEEIEDIPVW